MKHEKSSSPPPPTPPEVAEPGHAPRLDESRGQRRREAEGARRERAWAGSGAPERQQ